MISRQSSGVSLRSGLLLSGKNVSNLAVENCLSPLLARMFVMWLSEERLACMASGTTRGIPHCPARHSMAGKHDTNASRLDMELRSRQAMLEENETPTR